MRLQQTKFRAVRGLVVAAAFTTFALACDRPAQQPATTANASTPAEAPVTVSSKEFQQLRWLEGTWVGSGGGYRAFYERYHWVDDSTIRKYDHKDSTFAAASDSSDIALRGGQVRNESPRSAYAVVAIDSVSVRFAPLRGAVDGFEWRKTGVGAWTARLQWDSAGTPKVRIYEMRAMVP